MRHGAEFWKAHIEAHQRLGQSRAAYAAEHGLSVQSLGWWARKLKAREAAPSTTASPGFVALRLEPGTPGGFQRCTLRCGELELELPSLPTPHWLAGLAQALRQAR